MKHFLCLLALTLMIQLLPGRNMELPLQHTVTGNFNLPCADSYTGAIYLQITGGTPPYAVSWNQAGLAGDTIINLLPGNYYCTITDANAEMIMDSFLISSPPQITAYVSTTLAYPNYGTASVINVAGGVPPYTYLWEWGETTSSIEGSAGFYICTITDANGCTREESAVLHTLPPISVAINNSQTHLISCFGGSDGALGIDFTGGEPPYSVLWSNGDTGQFIQQLPSGFYTCTVTDALGGTGTTVLILNDPPIIVADFQVTNATDGQSNGAIINTFVYGGQGAPYTFLWNNGDTTPSITGLPAGSYTCKVTDALGCMRTTTETVETAVGTADLPSGPVIRLSPNPAHDSFHIQSDDLFNIVQIKIFDAQGRIIYAQTGSADIATSAFAAGQYFVEILDDEKGSFLQKIMIVH